LLPVAGPASGDERDPPVSARLAAAEQAPRAAGVYFLLASEGELLYVAKASNLRGRLEQHAAARLGNPDARLAALYERVGLVRWEELSDEQATASREADVIVALRPAFNASHVAEGRWTYVIVSPRDTSGGRLRFALSPTLAGEPDGLSFGCFPHLGRRVSSRPGIACSDGYTALLRLLWSASEDRASSFPSRMTRSAPDLFETNVSPTVIPSARAFLSERAADSWTTCRWRRDAAERTCNLDLLGTGKLPRPSSPTGRRRYVVCGCAIGDLQVRCPGL